MIADALGQPLTLSRESEASSRGVALLALDSLGIPPGLAGARAPDGERVEPDPTRQERYAEATARHSRLYDALVGSRLAADQRLRYLVEQGFTPCIVGAWGYFMPWMGVEKTEKHWRYLIARYGAWPVTWCVAGEDNLPWYLAKGFPYDDREQAKGWTEVARYVRDTDPFHRMLTIHPTGIGPCDARHAVSDDAVLDYNMLQTPHGQREAVAPTYNIARAAYEMKPTMAIMNGLSPIYPEWGLTRYQRPRAVSIIQKEGVPLRNDGVPVCGAGELG